MISAFTRCTGRLKIRTSCKVMDKWAKLGVKKVGTAVFFQTRLICRQRKTYIVKIQSNWRGYDARRQLALNDGQDRCEVCGVLDGKDVRLDMCDGCKISLFCSGKYKYIFAWVVTLTIVPPLSGVSCSICKK